jgi:RNA polymerase sigma-70 factor, ECF subfamily
MGSIRSQGGGVHRADMASTLADPRHREFERLYTRHVVAVHRFALSLVRDPAAAEDVTQTTFLNAFRALESGEHPRLPETWLLTIAHNVARSRMRRAMRRPREVPLDEAAELASPELVRQNVPELVRALRRLPRNQRDAVTMRELEGCSYPEIATRLGVSVPAVESLLSRARRTLRKQAAAIRGLGGAFGLPALRDALGAAGAAVVAKSAVVVVAGVVAGGAASAAHTPAAHAPTRAAVSVGAAASASAPRRATVPHGTSRAAARGTVPVVRPGTPRAERSQAVPESAAGPERAAAPSSEAASAPPPVAAVEATPVTAAADTTHSSVSETVDTVSQTVDTVVSTVPAALANPAGTPPVPPPPPVVSDLLP